MALLITQWYARSVVFWTRDNPHRCIILLATILAATRTKTWLDRPGPITSNEFKRRSRANTAMPANIAMPCSRPIIKQNT